MARHSEMANQSPGVNLWQAILGAAAGVWYAFYAREVARISTAKPTWEIDLLGYQCLFIAITFTWFLSLYYIVQMTDDAVDGIWSARQADDALKAVVVAGRVVLIALVLALSQPIVYQGILMDRTDIQLSWVHGAYGVTLVLFVTGGRLLDAVLRRSSSAPSAAGDPQ